MAALIILALLALPACALDWVLPADGFPSDTAREWDWEAAEAAETDAACADGLRRCGEACVNVESDHDNCGECLNRCTPDQFCYGGECVPACSEGKVVCGGACVDTRADLENCGTCGTACTAGANADPVCLTGICAVRCRPGWSDLDGDGSCETNCVPTSDVEVCNGLDDNCNSDVDEGFDCALGEGVACMTACGTAGTGVCTGYCRVPEPALCTPPRETCNGGDDDCDGTADDGFACAAGREGTQPCGACGSGTKRRTCSSSCAWGEFGPCAGERGDYPVNLATSTPVCPPYDRPAVFFAPHPDDESIAMAGSIKEHVDATRDVFIELMTRGEGSAVRAILSNGQTCTWHEGTHSFSLTAAQLGDARLLEFKEAAGRLGVTGIFVSDFGDGDVTNAEVSQRIAFWTTSGGAGLSLKALAGSADTPPPGGTANPDHVAVWNALVASGYGDLRGYFIYVYVGGTGAPGRIDTLTPALCTVKQGALGAYKTWSPTTGRYAVGYHSVASMIDAASSDCREFVYFP